MARLGLCLVLCLVLVAHVRSYCMVLLDVDCDEGRTYTGKELGVDEPCLECQCSGTSASCCATAARPGGFDEEKCELEFDEENCKYSVLEKKRRECPFFILTLG